MVDGREHRLEQGSNSVSRATRWVAIAILPFLGVASALLYLWPGSTDVTFSWTITPPLSAMVLASAYLGGIWFFGQVLRTRRWHEVRHGFPAVVVFAGLAAVATVLHWDKFHSWHVSFLAWVVLYLCAPIAVLALWVRNRQADPRTPNEVDVILPRLLRVGLGMVGLLALVTGLALFLFPEPMSALWGWSLTPLTARITGAVLTLPGMVNVWFFVDARWSAFRRIVQAEVVSLWFLIGAVILARDDVAWERPAASVFAGGLAVALLGYAVLYSYAERRMKKVVGSGRGFAPR